MLPTSALPRTWFKGQAARATRSREMSICEIWWRARRILPARMRGVSPRQSLARQRLSSAITTRSAMLVRDLRARADPLLARCVQQKLSSAIQEFVVRFRLAGFGRVFRLGRRQGLRCRSKRRRQPTILSHSSESIVRTPRSSAVWSDCIAWPIRSPTTILIIRIQRITHGDRAKNRIQQTPESGRHPWMGGRARCPHRAANSLTH
jgi:hypothetical protein